MRLLAIVCLFAGSLLTSPAVCRASQESNDDIIDFAETVPTPSDIAEEVKGTFKSRATSVSSETGVLIDFIVNLGERVWSVIEKNKPVVDIHYTYANALPQGIKSSGDLEKFSAFQYQSYRVHGKNGFGATPYDVTYTLIHRYGGSYLGRGQYLENVTVLPASVDVSWGYTVNMGITHVSAVNVGTKEAPVASILMEMVFTVSTVMKTHQHRAVYEFRGDSAKVRAIE